MKNLIMTVLVILAVLAFEASAKSASAPQSSKKKISKSISKKKSKLSTDVDFDGSTLHGRYQKSAESLATVESEKAMMDLLANRKNFKDRLAKTGSVR